MGSRTYTWNWNNITGTKNESNRVRQSSASLTARTFPSRGSWDITSLNSIHIETLNDITKLFSHWNTVVQPILDSLSAGGNDRRWGGLRTEIDALRYGLDATTLFVSQDASPTNFDGRYWHTSDKRPYTIAEVIEDHEGRMSLLENNNNNIIDYSSFDDTDLWDAIGWGKKPGSITSSSTSSLHGTQLIIQSQLTKIAKDVYGINTSDPSWPNYLTTWNGSVFKYGIYEYLAKLTAIHGVDMTSFEDPWNVNHDDIEGTLSPPWAQSQVLSSGYSELARGSELPADLEEDLKRIRYELSLLRGTDWNSGDQDGPFDITLGNSFQSFTSHINMTGNGSGATLDNPHNIGYTDTGADLIFSNVAQYIGQTDIFDISPQYTSTYYITNGSNLTSSMSALDSAINNLSEEGFIRRLEVTEDRSWMTDAQRSHNPISITHNFGRKPIVQVLDLSDYSEDTYGHYQSLDEYSNIVHSDNNTIEVWSECAIILVIIIG
jgi:hypothetical protein